MAKAEAKQNQANRNGDHAEVQAPKEVEGPNTPQAGLPFESFPYVEGYVCIPVPIYDMIIDHVFNQPYHIVDELADQLKNVSAITKARRQMLEMEASPPNMEGG